MRNLKKRIKFLFRISLLMAVILFAPYFSDKAHKVYLYEYVGSSVVRITGEDPFGGRSGGTGFQVEHEGKIVIMTNMHVCQLADQHKRLEITDANGRKYSKKIIKLYSDHDLCAVEPVPGIRALSLAGAVHRHEPVHLIGHPRLDPITLQSGFVVSPMTIQINYLVPENQRCFTKQSRLEADEWAPIGWKTCVEWLETLHINVISYGGNSGSPVVDDLGNVVAVLFAGRRDALTATYCVPLWALKDFLSELE